MQSCPMESPSLILLNLFFLPPAAQLWRTQLLMCMLLTTRAALDNSGPPCYLSCVCIYVNTLLGIADGEVLCRKRRVVPHG